eukprot:364501-Chlamydomonas_euryale.AAC.9
MPGRTAAVQGPGGRVRVAGGPAARGGGGAGGCRGVRGGRPDRSAGGPRLPDGGSWAGARKCTTRACACAEPDSRRRSAV